MQGGEVLTIKDVAALLKVGEKTIYSMAQGGELPASKVRGQWRFSRKDLDAWMEQQKHSTQDFGEGQKIWPTQQFYGAPDEPEKRSSPR